MNAAVKVLIVEDDPGLAAALGVTVRKAGGLPVTVHSGARALAALHTGGIGLVILDIGLPDRNGLDVLREAATKGLSLPPVLVITAHGAIENAIEARRLGVAEFFDKPVDLTIFQSALAQALQSIQEAAPISRAEPNTVITYVGAAESMRPVFQAIAQACVSGAPVLIEGETGTGKTLTANLILRQDRRFDSHTRIVAADSASVAERLESILAGEEHPAAVLIEEIARLEPTWQERLATWLEDTRDGPRILSTSSSALWPLVRQGRFAAALYYRLQPGRIALPALRDRLSDLPALSSWFLGEVRPGASFRLKSAALRILEEYAWPGNIRELRNALEWACHAAGARLAIEPDDLPATVRVDGNDGDAETETLSVILQRWLDERLKHSPTLSYRELLDEVEGPLLRDLLRRHQNKPSRLAAERGLNRSTLRRRLQDLGIAKADEF